MVLRNPSLSGNISLATSSRVFVNSSSSMATHFSLSAILCLLAASSALMVMVASDRCKELIGDCSDDCNNRCASAHQGGVGMCEPGEGGKMGCWCYYDCPALQTCEENFKLDGGCTGDIQCDSACAAKHPGQGAQGTCDFNHGQRVFLCHCTYFCNNPPTKFVP